MGIPQGRRLVVFLYLRNSSYFSETANFKSAFLFYLRVSAAELWFRVGCLKECLFLIRDGGMYWIFGYVRETIVQLDNTP